MLKHVWLMCLLLGMGHVTSYGCDVCGGAGAAGNYYGIVPQFYKNFIGLRYNATFYTSRSLPSILNDKSIMAKLNYNTVTLWGRWYPHKRFQIFGFLPYSLNALRSNTVNDQAAGLGDASILLQYIILNTGDSTDRSFKHTWLAGGGVKAPTGSNPRDAHAYNLASGLNAGAGAWGYIWNTNYTLRYDKFGSNTELSYQVMGKSGNGYHKGNSLAASTKFFYWYQATEVAWLPQLGASLERAARDEQDGYYQRYTGGYVSYATLGADIYYKNIFTGVKFQQPLIQELSEGYMTAHAAISAHLTFMF